jgi:hypothetical protein
MERLSNCVDIIRSLKRALIYITLYGVIMKVKAKNIIKGSQFLLEC